MHKKCANLDQFKQFRSNTCVSDYFGTFSVLFRHSHDITAICGAKTSRIGGSCQEENPAMDNELTSLGIIFTGFVTGSQFR